MSHIYYNDNGEPLPSTTHILNIISKKNFSIWANSLGFRRINIKKYIEEKALIGSLVHHRIECFMGGNEEYKPFIDQSINEIVDKRFNNFMTWYNTAKPKVIWQEKEFHNDRYGGRIDLLAELKEGEPMLIDFKTSKQIGVSHLLQLGGYLNLIQYQEPEMYNRIKLCGVVAIKDNAVTTKVKTIEEMKKYQETFEYAYEMYIAYDKILKEDWDDSLKDLSMF